MGSVRRVEGSPYYQIRYKDAAGKWKQVSSRQTDEGEALAELEIIEQRIREFGGAERRLLTIQEVAEWLAVNETTVRRLYKCGEIPGIRVGAKLIRFDAADVKKFIADAKTIENGKRQERLRVSTGRERSPPGPGPDRRLKKVV